MNILIDTSYFLPLIKIAIKNIPHNLLISILSETPHTYFYTDLTIFELIAKGLKLSTQKSAGITPQDIRAGVDSLQHDTRLIKRSYTHNPYIIELTSLFRMIHQDTIDCLIFAAAICTCDCLITMDVSFYKKINKNPQILKKIKAINEDFKFWFNDLSDSFKSLDLNDIK